VKEFKYFLSVEYPYNHHSIWNIILVSFSVSMFILILQPFGFANYENSKLVAASGFGLITFINLVLNNYLVKKQLRTLVKKWTAMRELFNSVGLLTVICVTNFVYFSIITDHFDLSYRELLSMIFITVSFGIFPVLTKYNRRRLEISTTAIAEANQIRFSSINKTERDFCIAQQDVLFIEATKNHVQIYYKEEDTIKTKCMRNTLSSVLAILPSERMFRCHRSFIINLDNIQSAKGNSNGYKVYFETYKHFIPVSRSYIKTFQQLYA